MPGVTPKQVFSLPRPNILCRGLSQEAQLEYEQAVIRVVFTFLVVLYFFIHGLLDGAEGIYTTAFYLASGYEIFSIGIILSFIYFKDASRIRKMLTMIGDHGMTCLAMYRADEAGAPLFTVLLWITVGYGARYGMSYLYLGMFLSSSGLLLLINTAGFWLEHPIVGYGMIVTNTVIPIFVSKLLKQLSDSKAKAEQADEAKGRFLANMSHEMRTPLSGIIGISKLLYKENLGPSTKASIVTIDQSANHLLQLIDDVLNFSRIEAGTLHIDHEHFDVYETIHTISDTLRPVATDKKLGFHVFISTDVPTSLVGDANRLKQVLLNLCGNAIKFTKSGYVEVRVNALAVSEIEASLRFEIIDTGIGIPQEALPHIFDRFNQVDDSITRQYGGSGLGTTISKELVELMGGQIHVQSDLGAGSRFYFDIPFLIGETFVADEYNDAKCLIYTKRDSIRERLFSFTSRWGMNIVTTSDLHNVCRMLVENRDGTGLPILLLDGSSIDGELLEFVQFVKFGVSDEVEVVLIDTKQTHHDCEGAITAIVNDLTTPKQLFNAIHAASRKYDLPSGVTPLSDAKKDHFKKLNVLIAEDSSVNRTILEEILRSHDMNVVSAEDGDEALELFEDNHFDVAILDMQMPNVGGLDVIREYNSGYGLFRKMPFIVLTANVTTDAKLECERAGASAYMKKPVDEEELLQLIYKFTGKQGEGKTDRSKASTEHGNRFERDILPDVIDIDVVNNLMSMSSKVDFFDNLVENYLNDLSISIKVIEDAIAANDFNKYHNEAHAIKGASANIGAKEVFEVARLANDDSKQDFTEYAKARCKDLQNAMRTVEISFKELINARQNDMGNL
jgi:two-component system sensor histidine kinase RpfC